MVTDNTEHGVRIHRAALQGSRRVQEESEPLFRGEIPGSAEDDVIEIPVSAIASKDSVEILHVDDDPDLGEATKTFLERVDEEFAVTTATSAVEGLDLLDKGAFDCVISDYEMPNTNGIEFLELVREQYPDLPFILFTGKGSEEVASDAIASGATDYMQKRMGTDQYDVLANRVKNAVDQYRAQQRFWDALTWYQQLVEQNLTGVFITQERELVYVNRRLAEMFGYCQSDLIDASPLTIVDDADTVDVLERLTEVENGDSERTKFEFTGTTSGGDKITIQARGGQIQYEGEPGCLCVIWDGD